MGKRGFPQKACIACHRRKIKCEVASQGEPCVQCRIRGRQCVFPGQEWTRTSPSTGSRFAAHSIGDPDIRPSSSLARDVGSSSANSSTAQLTSISPSWQDSDTDDIFHLMVQYITIPSPPPPLLPSHPTPPPQSEEQRLISAFFDRSDIVSSVVKPLYDDIIDSPPSSSPAALLRQAVICSAYLGDAPTQNGMTTQQALATDIYDKLKSMTSSGGAGSSGIHVICALVVMSDVWPNMPQPFSRSSPLVIDVTEVEAIMRLWTAYRDSHPPDLFTFGLLDWYIHLLDAMNAADQGRLASLSSMPDAMSDQTRWSLAAASLVDIGRTMGNAAHHRQWDRLVSLHDNLQQWALAFSEAAATASKEGCRVFPLLSLLLHHLFMSLENHVSHMPTGSAFTYADISTTVRSEVIKAAAGVSWSAILDLLEQHASGDMAPAQQSSVFVEVGVGCLFWGLDQAKMRLASSHHQPLLLALLFGSQQFIRLLEPQIQHRLDLQSRLAGVKEELLLLTTV